MEWIDGVRCTDPAGIKAAGIDVDEFIRVGVVSGLRQLLEFGLFHGDPHPGNIFAMRDGRIAYVDFGNVAQLSQRNKEVLIDAVVHAVNEDYEAMAGDFIQLARHPHPETPRRPLLRLEIPSERHSLRLGERAEPSRRGFWHQGRT